MGFEAPGSIVPTSEERELLLRFLHRKREQVVATASGLTDEQAAWAPEGRLLPIGGVINHLTQVEWRWIDGRYLGCEFPPRVEEFQIGEASLSELIDAYWRRAQRTEEVVRDASSLDTPCMGTEGQFPPADVLLGLSEPLDLRWAVLHLIEETAHHAGHADATREMLDARTGG